MAAKVRLPRKRFFSLKGNQVELAVGLLLVSILEAKSADATVTRDGLTGNAAPAPDAPTPPPSLEKMLGVAPDAVKTISIADLKAHLTTSVLASLGLDDKILDLLDHDRAAAIQELEDAYRKKLAMLAGDGSHLAAVDGDATAQGDDAQGGDDSAQGDGDDSGDQDSGFLGIGHDFLPLFILAGVAGVAAAGVIATSGGDHKDHPPTAVNDAVTTNEDTSTTFDVRTNDTDPDGDPLTVTQINGTTIDSTHPVTITGGVISIGADGRLTFTPTANYNGTPSFTYTISDGRGGTATGTVNLTVTAVNDAPVNTVPASLAANAGSVLTIGGLAISDVDGGGGYTTTIKVGNGTLSIVGTVTGGATVAGAGTGTLVLTGTIDQINATLKAIGYTSGTGFVGSTTLTITTSDGSLTDTDTVTLTVSTAVAGLAEDGYIANAKVFIDVNGNGKYDAGEPTTTTDANGRFAFTSDKPGNVLVIGGTNTDTGLPNTLVLSAPMGSTVVNPLTTLIVGLMASGLTLAQANAALAASLGLSHSIDFTHFDFLAPSDDADFSLAVQKLAVEISTIMILAGAAAGANAGDVQASIVAHFVALINGGGHIDLTDLSTIHSLLVGSGLTDSQINSITAHASAINNSVDSATSSADITHTVVETSPGHSSPTVDGVLAVTQDSIGDVVTHIGDYTALGITTLDAIDNSISLTDTQADALVHAGIHFVDSDMVTVGNEGTHLSTSLKGLESLHVDTVMIAGASLSIAAGSGLDGISTAGLPQFVHSANTSVTLDVTAGTVNPSLDLTDLAKTLHNDGINHIGVTGGELILTDAQAHELVAGGLDILPAADVGLTASVDEVHALALDPTFLAAASVDHIDVTGDNITLSDSEAHALVAAGVDFVPDDNVQVNADGTHLSTSLKGLGDLHVDTVMITGASHAVIIDAGASLAALSTETLPHFAASGGVDPDVTLNIAGGTIDSTTDVASIAHTLQGLGVDHIGVSGDGGLTLTADQATAFHDAGLDFASGANITLDLTADQLASLVLSQPTDVHDFGVDHLNVAGPVSLSDHDASALVAAGLDFVASDDVHVHAVGTHMSSSLSDLQALHVDSISVDAGVTDLHIAGGDLSLVTSGSLPQFDVDQSDASLNVTLHVDRTQLYDLDRLGTSLRDAGIDHFGVDQPLNTYDAATQAYMTQITHDTGISFVYDPQPGSPVAYSGFGQDAVHSDDGLVQSIVTAFQQLEDHGHGGQVIVQDDVIPALAESGALRAYVADTLVVDGQHSGDLLLTTLKDIADLGVDHVVVSDTGGPAYVDIGSFSGDELTQVKSLFTELSANVTGTKIFEGNSKVALVVDESVAHALSQVDGSMEKLASLGFTEVDVLMNAGSTTPPITSTAVEVKLIGQDDDLYKHLHHD